MKRLVIIILIVLLVLGIIRIAFAAANPPALGGTGTSTLPVKGAILVGQTSTNYGVLTVGSNGQCPIASSTASFGISWGSCGSGGGGSVSTSSALSAFNFPFWFNTTGGLSGTSTLSISFASSTQLLQNGSFNASGTITQNGVAVGFSNVSTSTANTWSASQTFNTTTTFAANVKLSSTTASSVLFLDGSNLIQPLTIGSGLTLTGNSLAATASASGTISNAAANQVAYYSATSTINGTSSLTFIPGSGNATATVLIGTSSSPGCLGQIDQVNSSTFGYVQWYSGIPYFSTNSCQ